MIFGIGCDLIQSERVIKACEKESFLKRYYTEKEISQMKERKSRCVTGFAAKEAVSKAFGTGFRGFMPIDIEVVRNDAGAPCIRLYGGAAEFAKEQGITAVHVSLSDDGNYAQAFAVAEKG